ncbi:tRNA pseudouridine(38/39) synthase [[Candida] anglica]
MLKRAFSFLVGTERAVAADYERWSRAQLIDRIRELERGCSGESVEKHTTSNTSSGETIPNKDSACVSSKSEGTTVATSTGTDTTKTTNTSSTVTTSTTKGTKKPFNITDHNRRFIALRFAYTGWNYNGLAFQNEPTPLPTVEEVILKALATAKLIAAPEPHCCGFSRCGRTDKGVSALNQVISLKVRSRLSTEEQQLASNDSKEIPYVTVLNTLLPTDIRVTAVCLRPPEGFDARFSCDHRHYKYVFRHHPDLDLDLMRQAALKFEGGHDFRNFCKIDGSKQITNYRRQVISAQILPLKKNSNESGKQIDDFYVFDLKGSAFLWHQVRCMMAILFLVGQKLESPEIIDKLLDVTQVTGRPVYEMADDLPLVLYDCVFPEMEWLPGVDMSKGAKLVRDNADVMGLLTEVQIKAIVSDMLATVATFDETKITNLDGCGAVNIGDGRGRNYKKYTNVLARERLAGYEEVNAKHREKKRRRLERAETESAQ